jgi:hypothetical protein
MQTSASPLGADRHLSPPVQGMAPPQQG